MGPKNSRAGGFFLMAAILIGLAFGTIAGEISMGILIGGAAGIAIAVLLWLVDRRSR